VIGGAEAEPIGKLVDGALERGIFERDQLAALVADEVMVVLLPGRVGWLVSRDSVSEVESVDEVVGVQQLQHPVDAGPANRPLSGRPRRMKSSISMALSAQC
jgi:hypothetical protein